VGPEKKDCKYRPNKSVSRDLLKIFSKKMLAITNLFAFIVFNYYTKRKALSVRCSVI